MAQGVATRAILGRRTLGKGDGEWLAKYWLCWKFLEVVAALYPQVLDDLARFPHDVSDLREEGEARQWLREWATRHGLASDLVLRAAFKTLYEWGGAPPSEPPLSWVFPDTTYQIPNVSLEPYDPITESNVAWLARVKRWTNQLLKAYEEAGYPTALSKTAPVHFEWLAHYAVGQYSLGEIAAGKPTFVSKTAVHRTIRFLGKTIGLTLTPRKAGRPRGRRTSPQAPHLKKRRAPRKR
jgi:hypothetical protein